MTVTTLPFGKPVISAVLAFVFALGGYGEYVVLKKTGYGAPYSEGMHRVTNVIDGDTFEIDNGEVVRLIGIDAPEMGKCYGEESQKALARLILDTDVELRKDNIATDRYGRLLRYVYSHNANPKVDSIFVNKEMVEKGYARTLYTRDNSKHYLSFAHIENDVEEKERGMWGECEYTTDRVRDNDYTSAEAEDEECVIKSNVNSKKEKRYFLPGCGNYTRVKVEPHKSEQWFCTEEEATQAGFVKSASCDSLNNN